MVVKITLFMKCRAKGDGAPVNKCDIHKLASFYQISNRMVNLKVSWLGIS